MSYSIIVPSRNIGNLTKCVSQLREMGETGRVIVVWDFGSAPRKSGYVGHEFVTRAIPSVGDLNTWAYEGTHPFIFARACNQGIAAAGTDDVVLMNDDALLRTPDGFTMLRYLIEEDQRQSPPLYGAVCPGFTHGSVGTINLVNRGSGVFREEKVMLVFACVYIPRSTIDRVGLLDERFGINAGGPGARGYGLEDDDYSLRIRQAGLKLGVYDGVLVDHLPQSTGLKPTFRDDPEHPHDVRAHEDVFFEKWGHWPDGHGFAPGRNKPR